MSKILCLETSTRTCSVAIVESQNCLVQKLARNEKYTHAENLHVFIQKCLSEVGLSVKELGAIAVSKGPGSYTGLRIGVSAAKGLAYAAELPIITLETPEILTYAALDKRPDFDHFLPMIDARRMEVYTAVYNAKAERVSDISAEIIDHSSFKDLRDQKVAFFGDGAQKCQESFAEREHWTFLPEIYPEAQYMATPASLKLEQEEFEDTAYFEPFYLKEFIAGNPKKLL